MNHTCRALLAHRKLAVLLKKFFFFCNQSLDLHTDQNWPKGNGDDHGHM